MREQNGHDRAAYGKALLANIAAAMSERGIPNMDERELRRYRQFYAAYPAAANMIAGNNQIRGMMPPELVPIQHKVKNDAIRGLATPELQIPDTHYFNLFNRVSYSHFVELIRVDDPLKRLFYELECIKVPEV